MARNERGGHLDKSTRNHLIALDAFIETQFEKNKPVQADEFTAKDYMDGIKKRGGSISYSQASKLLIAKAEDGELEVRKANVKGTNINVFKFSR